MNYIYTLETGVMVEGGHLETVSDSLDRIKSHPMYTEKEHSSKFRRTSKRRAMWYRIIKKWDLKIGGYEVEESTYYEPNNFWNSESNWGMIRDHRYKQSKNRRKLRKKL